MKVAWLFKVTLLGSSVLMWAHAAHADRAKQLFSLCAACHGENAAGNVKLAAPAIAGLPEWYLTAQLNKFREGHRGQHPRDDAGNRMRPMAKTLRNNDKVDDLALVAAYVSKLTPPPRQEKSSFPQADAVKGKALYAVCASCHGDRAEGKQAMNAPGLARLDDWYLFTQLKNYKNGVRGGDPRKDPQGALMAPMAKSLKNDQAIQDVIAYIKTLQ